MINLMIFVFIAGYVLIALEHKINIDKSPIALLLGTLMWVMYSFTLTPEQHLKMLAPSLLNQVASISEIIFFLLGAMTTVEIIDRHRGFDFVGKIIRTTKKRTVLWLVSLITFMLSAALDNLTTSIVMVMVLRKLIQDQNDRMIIASMIVIAANAGGAFSPIGDVTTIMLWLNGNISALNFMIHLIVPTLASLIIPLIIVSLRFSGNVQPSVSSNDDSKKECFNKHERIEIFIIGVGGLMLVPVFKDLTSLPPFIGVVTVLAVLWIYTELIYRQKKSIEDSEKCRVTKVLKNVDFPTIFFFFGILLAVAGLDQAGILSNLAKWFNKNFDNVYLITGSIGILSSVIDNVPLVASAMGMYDIVTPDNLHAAEQAVSSAANPQAAQAAVDYMKMFVCDGDFWQLVAYTAGVGGSMLIIGSAAGVVVMGLEKITFFWYLKKISWLAFIGFLSGILVYYIQQLIL